MNTHRKILEAEGANLASSLLGDAQNRDRSYETLPTSNTAAQTEDLDEYSRINANESLHRLIGPGDGELSGRTGSWLQYLANLLTRLIPGLSSTQSQSDPSESSQRTKDKSRITGDTKPKVGSLPRPIGGSAKLGTFDGVFVPTSLNVLSILMFLRFGFLLGQAGVIGMIGMLVVCYLINLVTTMSISAIATNGTVRGGGAYYLISRSLGPEFGGSIGIVFYLGFVFNTGMNAVGLVDCFISNFGTDAGSSSNWLPEGYWWQYLWATIVLVFCTCICLAGSGLFARCSNGLLVVLLIATISIPASTFFLQPFSNNNLNIDYTGLSLQTFKENLMPRFTRGAAGSQIKGKETYQDLFGILFPATGGIFAGASMSGDLQNPSKSIPRGTLYGLAVTFVLYALVIMSMAASISRTSMHRNLNIIQDVNVSGVLILLGESATSLFSALMGVIGSAKLLQALARDKLVPGLSIFGQGTKVGDGPTYAIIVTYAVAQLTMLSDINQIASFVTMTYLMTFLVTNLACFLLELSSAPNFRPSFHYFNSWTAALGTVVSGATMFFVDGVYATVCVGILVVLFVIIHYTTAPKAWGDVSQSLIYHQVRKYLLRLRQEHVKFWRPQILLFVNDPRRSYKLIQFCNSLKKGSLFILGHVIVTPDFAGSVAEARKQQKTWTSYIDFSKVKAFVNVGISPAIEWGMRNVVLNAGLGGMRPNIIVMGFYNLDEYRKSQPEADGGNTTPRTSTKQPKSTSTKKKRRRSYDERMSQVLPTDTDRSEKAVGAKSYVTGLEDLILSLQVNVAIAKGFDELELPPTPTTKLGKLMSVLPLRHLREEEETIEKKYIDLWPIQMSANVPTKGEGDTVSTTNFDTIALILQLGCILHTVPAWHRAFKLRVAVFVEYESDVEEERGRFEALLTNLRIEAEVMVSWLASGDLQKYEYIVNGNRQGLEEDGEAEVEEALKDEDWWSEVQEMRSTDVSSPNFAKVLTQAPVPDNNFIFSGTSPAADRTATFDVTSRNRRSSVVDYGRLGVSLTMQTNRLDPRFTKLPEVDSSGEESESNSESEEELSDSSDSFVSIPASTTGLRETQDMEDNDSSRPSPSTEVRTIEEPASKITITRPAPEIEDRPVRLQDGFPFIYETSEWAMQDSLGFPAPTPHRPLSAPASPHAALVPTQASSSPSISQETTATSAKLADQTTDNDESRNDTLQPLQTLPRHLRPSGRPLTLRHSSYPRLSSNLVPRATVAADEGPGPSIMFSTPSPPSRVVSNPLASIYGRYINNSNSNTVAPTGPGSPVVPVGRPRAASAASGTSAFTQSQPLSFNALPCRAQHLILNELMRKHSGSSGVLFTTLPAPVAGTSESDEESLRYLEDLQVLCQGLPPVLMVHSNSMSVTMNL